MRLYEFQAKRIFKEKGILVPESILARTKTQIPRDFFPSVYKAQVLTGGRSKAGAVKVVEHADDAEIIFDKLMKLKVKNESVFAILIEEKKSIVKEYYLSLMIDKQKGCPVFIASSKGGVDIEKVALETPNEIIKQPVDYLIGLRDFDIRKISKFLEISDTNAVNSIMHSMYAIFLEEDATLVEINPLADTENGIMALDAKIILDDKAAFRHEARFAEIKNEQEELEWQRLSPDEKLAKKWEITYVKLDGNIGIISDGAGTGMLTLDLVIDYGGKAASFCELGGLGDAERMSKGLQVVTSNPAVKVVLVSLIGGITRMDDMASGIIDFLNNHESSIPIVVRMCGTQEEEGKRILGTKNIPVDQDLEKTVSRAVEYARN